MIIDDLVRMKINVNPYIEELIEMQINANPYIEVMEKEDVCEINESLFSIETIEPGTAIPYTKVYHFDLPKEPYSVVGKITNYIYFSGTKSECYTMFLNHYVAWNGEEMKKSELPY